MNFKEIMEIDRHPFSEQWEKSFYENLLCFINTDIFFVLSILLIQRFLEKFNQKYGTEMYIVDNDSKWFLLDYIKELSEYDDGIEFMAEYKENCWNLFADMAFQAHFEIMHIQIEYNEWDIPQYGRKTYLKRKLRQVEPSWRPFILKNLNLIQDARCMEDGEVYILRNREIYIYHTFCEKFGGFVDTYLGKEREALDTVVNDLAYPLFFQSEHSHGFLGEYYYICFDTGYNGYGFLDIACLNFTWTLSCFVFRLLFEDFKNKVRETIRGDTELRIEQ